MLYVLRVDRNKYASLQQGDTFKWKLTRRRGRVADGISGDIILTTARSINTHTTTLAERHRVTIQNQTSHFSAPELYYVCALSRTANGGEAEAGAVKLFTFRI